MQCIECVRLGRLLRNALTEYLDISAQTVIAQPVEMDETDPNLGRTLSMAFSVEAMDKLNSQFAEHRATHKRAVGATDPIPA